MLFLHSTRFSILFPEDFIEIMKNLHRVRYVIHLRRCFLQLQIRTLNMKKLNNISHIIFDYIDSGASDRVIDWIFTWKDA